MMTYFPSTWRGRSAWLLPLITICVTLLLVAIGWPKFWLYINFDDTPMNVYQALLLVAAAAMAITNARIGFLADSRSELIIWSLVSMAFVYLALDEQFMIHELVRNQYLSNFGKLSFLPWVAAGDYLPLLYAVIGLMLLPRVWRFVAHNPQTRWCFALAIALSSVAVILDSIDWRALPGNWLGREQFIEECIEAMAYSLIVSAFLLARAARV